MDCNKEEAVRAKSIALMKMESRDFTGARKLARKAQQLYPDLENIAQMLVVCDVHCSAEQKLFGNEMDWYGILQIEQTANEATIKKQYRKLALLLHPDKNKFAGAEAAFKLIGEASRLLMDRDKRAMHDMKRRASMNKPAMSHRPPQRVYTNLNAGVQNNVRNNFTNLNQQPRQQGQQGPNGERSQHQQSRQQVPYGERPQHQQSRQQGQQGSNGERSTFWTVCPFCAVKYQYYTEVINKSLRCQNCTMSFVAYNVNVQGASPATNENTGNSNKEPLNKGMSSYTVSEKMNGKKRRKKTTESSESSESIGSTDSEEDTVAGEDGIFSEQNHSTYKEENPRRSARQKQQVSYKENRSDDEGSDLKPSKRAKGSASQCVAEEACGEAAKMNDQNGSAADREDDQKEMEEEHNLHSKESLLNRNEETKEVSKKEIVGGSNKADEASEHDAPDPSLKATENPEVLEYPDSEFSDFEKDKKEECFAAGQTWAIYDITEGMPRFYAVIKKVLSPGFKLEITWFEPDPIDEDEIKWVEEELPVACGRFHPGGTEITDAHPMFSHLICCEATGRGKKTLYKVYPRKGETWALFKNWDIKWHTDVESHRNYEYEFVEIMSDYVEGKGVSVAYLAKLKGFVSLFFRVVKEGNHSFQIPSLQLFRFSHRVPSFKMTGQEGVGVPPGSYELDPASLPLNIEEVDAPEGLEIKVSPYDNVNTSSSDRLKPTVTSDEDESVRSSNFVKENKGSDDDVEDRSAPSASTQEAVEIPDPQFYNFDADRSQEKLQIGQIWAFYSDEDALPKYYGQIEKIVTSPDLSLRVSWLASCNLPRNAIRWEKDKEMPVSCGRFKINRKNCNVYDNIFSISHQMRADTDGRNNIFAIFPRKGEVWALYRNWTPEMKRDDLVNWQYDMVEVLQESDLLIEVLVLEHVDGFNSVFRGKMNDGSAITLRILKTELLRFSHQIPAFKLTEEHGNLKGFWELDPPALPAHFFGSS